MRKIDDEIQALLLEHRGDIRSILKDNHRLDLLYALSSPVSYTHLEQDI